MSIISSVVKLCEQRHLGKISEEKFYEELEQLEQEFLDEKDNSYSRGYDDGQRDYSE